MFDVRNIAAHVVWSVEKNFVGALAPDWAPDGKTREEAKPVGCLLGEFAPDGFGVVAVPSHTEVHVITQHGAGPQRTPAPAHRLPDRFPESLPLRVFEPDQRKIEQRRSSAPELAQLTARGCDFFLPR